MSAFFHQSCLSVNLLHWYDGGDWCWSGRSNQSCFVHIFLSRKCLLLLLLHLTYLFLVLDLILYFVFMSFSRFGKLNNFFCYFIGAFFCNQIVCPNMKNYLSGWFFLVRLHIVFHIVLFSAENCFTTTCFLNVVAFEWYLHIHFYYLAS